MIRLPVGEVLRQAGSVVKQEHPDKTVSLRSLISCVDAIDAAASVIKGIDSEVLLTHPRSQGERSLLRQIALENVHSESANNLIGRPIRVTYDVSTLPSPVFQPGVRERLKENLPPVDDKDPYPIVVRAGLLDNRLPVVTANMKVMLIDDEDEGGDTLRNVAMIWDTGAQRTIITEELLSESFRARLQEPQNEPYRSADSTTVQITAVVAFSNTNIQISAVASVRPQERMPNRYLGILFGQQQCIDSTSHVCTPRKVLVARGEAVGDNVWGDIVLNDYVDVWGEVHSF